jgi:hypothetical protein
MKALMFTVIAYNKEKLNVLVYASNSYIMEHYIKRI